MRNPFVCPTIRPTIRAVLLAPVLAAMLSLALSAGPARADSCEQAIAVAAQRHGVDRNLMLAISRVESGLTPWVINAEGVGQYFSSKAEAMARVAALQATGVTSIDVGCMQVNLRWHPHAFAGLAQAFDPYANADYAARYLRRLRIETGSWTMAAVRYHSATPARQAIYGCAVQAEFDRLRRVAPRACVYRPEGGSGAVAVTQPAPAAGSPNATPPPSTLTVFRPPTPDVPETAAAPITEPAPVAVVAPGIRRPQIVRLAGGTDGMPVVTLRGEVDRSPQPIAPAGPRAARSAPMPPAEPVIMSDHQPRARVLLMPGATAPAPVSVISGAPPTGPGFSLD